MSAALIEVPPHRRVLRDLGWFSLGPTGFDELLVSEHQLEKSFDIRDDVIRLFERSHVLHGDVLLGPVLRRDEFAPEFEPQSGEFSLFIWPLLLRETKADQIQVTDHEPRNGVQDC